MDNALPSFKFQFIEQCNFGAFMAPSDEGAVSYADWGREKRCVLIKTRS